MTSAGGNPSEPDPVSTSGYEHPPLENAPAAPDTPPASTGAPQSWPAPDAPPPAYPPYPPLDPSYPATAQYPTATSYPTTVSYPVTGYETQGAYPPPTGPGYPPPGYPPSYPPPSYPPPGYPPSYLPPGYADPYGYGAYTPTAGTNGLAIGSLIASIFGFFTCGFGSIVGIILGVIALNQIKTTRQDGKGIAIAGISIGAGVLLLGFLLFAAHTAATPH